MNYKNIIVEVRKNFSSKQCSFSKEELAFYADKDTFRNKITGFMTSSYYKREKLLVKGFIFYALTFKEYREEVSNVIPTWILFSKAVEIDENPLLLQDVKRNLDKMFGDKKLRQKYHKLFVMYSENTSEPMYFRIPDEFSPNFECYLSIVNLRLEKFPSFKLGLNFILSNQDTSKEIVYLPEMFLKDIDTK